MVCKESDSGATTLQTGGIVSTERTANEANRRETFSRLIRVYGAALKRLSAAYVRDPGARDDLFQEIALALWIALPGFRGEASERTWLYRIAHNTASTHLHRMRRRGERERQPRETDQEPAADSTPGDELEQADQQQRLFSALRELPTLDFQIVTMHLAELSYAEIADVVGLTQTNVGARLSRVRKTLAKRIESADQTEPAEARHE